MHFISILFDNIGFLSLLAGSCTVTTLLINIIILLSYEQLASERASEPPGMRLVRVPGQPAELTRRRPTHGIIIDESRPRLS